MKEKSYVGTVVYKNVVIDEGAILVSSDNINYMWVNSLESNDSCLINIGNTKILTTNELEDLHIVKSSIKSYYTVVNPNKDTYDDLFIGSIYKNHSLVKEREILKKVPGGYIWTSSLDSATDSLLYRLANGIDILTTDETAPIYVSKDSLVPYYEHVCGNEKMARQLKLNTMKDTK